MSNRPFDQLSEDDQETVIDVVAAMSVLILRIPSIGQPIYDYVCTELVACRSLPANIVKYALRDAGKTLFTDDWDFTVIKRGKEVTTAFVPAKKENDGQTA